MENSFSKTIEVPQSSAVVFARIKDVSKWWGGPDLAGRVAEVGDEFTVIHGDAHYSKQKVTEVVPNRRIVWLVTESRLNWLQKDKSEWTGTKMIFELSAGKDSTKLIFTHEGLTPSKESYTRCAEGWAMVITEWLFDTEHGQRSHKKMNQTPPNQSLHRTLACGSRR
jgi:Activator of Hsp90 ATPase homolog 1-like protein